MNSTKRIYIYTGPVRKGKTSRLMAWAEGKSMAGILSPDKDGRRYFYSLAKKEWIEFELEADMEYSDSDIIEVGRFRFLKKAFNEVGDLLIREARESDGLIIVDELGKLEMQDEGLCKAIRTLLSMFRGEQCNADILIVVRDFLLDSAIEKFNLQDAIIIDFKEDLETVITNA